MQGLFDSVLCEERVAEFGRQRNREAGLARSGRAGDVHDPAGVAHGYLPRGAPASIRSLSQCRPAEDDHGESRQALHAAGRAVCGQCRLTAGRSCCELIYAQVDELYGADAPDRGPPHRPGFGGRRTGHPRRAGPRDLGRRADRRGSPAGTRAPAPARIKRARTTGHTDSLPTMAPHPSLVCAEKCGLQFPGCAGFAAARGGPVTLSW